MDPRDYDKYFLSLSTHTHDDELAQSRCPEHMKRDTTRRLAQGLESDMRHACSLHMVIRSEPGRLRNHTETRAEIVIMPAEELRTLLGFVGKLQAAVHSVRSGQVPQSVEAQP